MKPLVDVAFWNERAKQPDCLSVIKFNHVGCAILPLDEINHVKLVEQFNERMQRAERNKH